MFELSVNLGNILTIGSFLVGGVIFVITVKGDIRVIDAKLDSTDQANDLRFSRVEAQAEDTKIEMRKLGSVVVDLAKTTGRQDLTDERLLAQGKRIDEQGRLVNELSLEIRNMMKSHGRS